MIRFGTAILLTLLVAGNAAAALIVKDAEISPGTTLPALPYWISFTIANDGERTLELPRTYALDIVSPAGRAFRARYIEDAAAPMPEAFAGVVMAPGETRRIDLVTGDDIADGWMLDRRLRDFGTYQVRLILGAGDAAIVTPVMTVTVDEPAGIDAEAWKALLARTGGSAMLRMPKDDSIGQELWARYHESRYAPYFGVAASNEIRRSGNAERAEKTMSEAMVVDRDGIATRSVPQGRAMQKAVAALAQPDLASALRLNAEARAELEAILRTAPRELLRQDAMRALGRIRSDEALREQFVALKSPRE